MTGELRNRGITRHGEERHKEVVASPGELCELHGREMCCLPALDRNKINDWPSTIVLWYTYSVPSGTRDAG